MHPVAIGALVVGGGVVILRIRAVINKHKVASTNDPSLRPPPSQDAGERAKQQEAVVAAAKALPPPPRQFRTGEIIGVDMFANGFEISTMNDVSNPRPGLVTGIINMKVTNPTVSGFGSPEEDAKFIQAVFADNRFNIPPLLNDDGTIFPFAVLKSAVAANPNPEGGTDGLQGFMPPDKAASAAAKLGNGDEFNAGLQAQINPNSEKKAIVTTNDPPPSGDLIMRVAPSDSAAQVPGGGADKNGTVVILDPNASSDGVWAKIRWDGGNRPAATGFAKKKFLREV